ncbi:hypothetical protein F751_6670 [Auxenochlorella protothecoides]|uniref:Uncharacterized protein n=1 Tax=Auxenochlorella protothecoides TaxID=3075 RepID=A0A087SLV9_AUXPR|nr:hypothetical protein F751_6670 [Auxenochlorella protothecoides]KFM26713.1 hypothetical protein F751_6670 [Auxenochlorella protothecoides]
MQTNRCSPGERSLRLRQWWTKARAGPGRQRHTRPRSSCCLPCPTASTGEGDVGG